MLPSVHLCRFQKHQHSDDMEGGRPVNGAGTGRRTGKSSAAIDTAFLFASLTVLNLLIHRHDPGWLESNPTPWLLLPLAAGVRYGILPGVWAALLATTAVVILRAVFEDASYLELFARHPYYVWSVFAAGAGAGIVHRSITWRVTGTAERNRVLSKENAQLRETNALFYQHEASGHLKLLLSRSESIVVSEELQNLFLHDPQELDFRLLEFLRRNYGVLCAALYRRGADGTWRRVVPEKPSAAYPDSFSQSGSPAIGLAALETGQLATWKGLWKACDTDEVPDDDFVAAIPFSPGTPVEALVLVRRMEFESITWENLARIEAVIAWVFSREAELAACGLAAASPGSQSIRSAEDFRQHLRRSQTLEEATGLSSFVVIFNTTNEESEKRLRDAIRLGLRPVDIAGSYQEDSSSTRKVAILTPAQTEAIARAIADGLVAPLDSVTEVSYRIVKPCEALH